MRCYFYKGDFMFSFENLFGSLFTWDEPNGRLRYFFNHILIFIVMLFLIAILAAIPQSLRAIAYVFVGLIGLCDLYLIFTNVAKRIWDITGDKKQGIYWTIGLIVAGFIPAIGQIVDLASLIILLFVPGAERVED